MHILRVANFVSPTSGGIKTALRQWGIEYQNLGHRTSLIIPGPGQEIAEEDQGTVYRFPGTPVLRTGYSLMWSRVGLSRLMDAIAPDALEVHDRSTTRWMGRWAHRRDIGALMFSHENLTGIFVRRTPVPDPWSYWCADLVNRLSDVDFDAVVTNSQFAAEEFHRNGIRADVVPLAVDLETFTPVRDLSAYVPPQDGEPLHVIHCGRLSPEKNPGLSIETLRELVRRGHDARMTVFGTGPMLGEMVQRARNLPVSFHSYITDRRELAARMGTADVAIAPGPLETFGLAALEALALGLPTVCPDEGALQEVVGDGGTVKPSTPGAFADGVEELLRRPRAHELARDQARRFTWTASAEKLLAVHESIRRRPHRVTSV